jgi:hypothetical protein
LTYQMYYRMVSAYGARRAITRIDHITSHCIDLPDVLQNGFCLRRAPRNNKD